MFQYLIEGNKETIMTILNFNDMRFEVLDNPFSEKYAKFLTENINESREFYFMGESRTQIKDEIDKIVYMLGKEPTDDMNKLHEYFANNEDDPEMDRLNNLIHYYELVLNNFPPRWGMMNGTSILELTPEDYEHFTLERKPGWLYINYPHVGKHFAEIAYSMDLDIPKEQYVPQSLCRPSFHIWLGDEITKDHIVQFKNLRLSLAHGMLTRDGWDLPDIDDPALRMGYIPFAKISDAINTNELTNHLLKCKTKSKNQWELFKND